MIIPKTGSLVTIKAVNLKEGMLIHRDIEVLKVYAVEVDEINKGNVNIDYILQGGDIWSTWYNEDQAVTVEYQPGMNIIDIL